MHDGHECCPWGMKAEAAGDQLDLKDPGLQSPHASNHTVLGFLIRSLFSAKIWAVYPSGRAQSRKKPARTWPSPLVGHPSHLSSQ